MTLSGGSFAVAVGVGALTALCAVVTPARARPLVTGAGTTVAGAAAVAAGVQAVAGGGFAVALPWLLPLFGVRFALDAFGGLFVAVTGGVACAVAVYGIGYTGHGLRLPHLATPPLRSRPMQVLLPVFLIAMLLVPAADSVATLLVCWELMALASLVLVVAEHRRRVEVSEAGVWYAAMTHLGFVAILAGLLLFTSYARGDSFAALRAAATEMSPAARATVFVLVFLGFASKAGAAPLHAWLPRAHPEAPSHVSALMSAAMVNLGVYGIVRVGFDLLGGGSRWWWLGVLAVGALSAVYGILQSAMTTDLKRLLGYSTTENMGLVLLGVGAAGMFASTGADVLAGLALTAALLHVVNHAAFKTLLFLAAGSVLHATGTRDLDALGGLRARLPVTTAVFGIGALAASALPPGNGFVSEWLLVQSLVHGLPATSAVTAVTMPVAVAAVALTAGLSVATFVKAFGIGFLAKPRTDPARDATESAPSMLAGMATAAAATVALALLPGWLIPRLADVTAAADPALGEPVTRGALVVRLAGFTGSMSPLLLATTLVAVVFACLVVVRLVVGRRARRRARLWDCGGGPLTARMEYTATSFAEPVQRVFDDVVRPELDIEVSHVEESRYLVDTVAFRRRVPDRIERRLYQPVLTTARAWGRAGRQLANGSVNRYLAYGFCALVGLLVWLAVTS